MVDLYDEDAVGRQAMQFYRSTLEREASMRRARQGSVTYREGGEHSFWFDNAKRALYGPTDAALDKRLKDHGAETSFTHRAINTGTGTGGAATMPFWAEDIFGIGEHALAPVAALATNLPLPAKANSTILPHLSTGISAAVQSSQNTSVTDGSTTYVDTAQTCDVITAMGQITLSQQLIDFAAPHGYDKVLPRELGAAIGAVKESQVISGAGNGSNQLLGVVNQSGVQTIAASGSVAGIYDGIASAVALISTTRFRAPDFVAGSPELWAYLAAGIDTSGRPFMPPRPFKGVAPESIPGELLGMRYISDPQVASSLGSQYLIVGVSSDLILWSGPLQVTFNPQTYANTLSVLVTAHQYLAFGLMYSNSVVLVGPFSVPGIPGS